MPIDSPAGIMVGDTGSTDSAPPEVALRTSVSRRGSPLTRTVTIAAGRSAPAGMPTLIGQPDPRALGFTVVVWVISTESTCRTPVAGTFNSTVRAAPMTSTATATTMMAIQSLRVCRRSGAPDSNTSSLIGPG